MKEKLTKVQIKRRIKAKIAWLKRIGLKNRDFSIISNNCWGGSVYDEFALPYQTPTIGLWFPSDDYIKFISDLDFYLNSDLKQISYQECHAKDLLISKKESGRYNGELEDLVIGRLVDVDIIFLHYKTFEDAYKKWNRRKKRINYKRLIVKFNDQNGFHPENYQSFEKVNYPHKLFFTCDHKYMTKDTVFIPEKGEDGGVLDDTDIKKLPINIKQYLNSIL